MPIYEYACRVCGVHFERKQSVDEVPVQTCPECGGQVRKVLFPAGIIFKGSGFYKTDYASSSTGSSTAEASSSGKSEPAKAEAPKAESAKGEPAKSESKADK